ncbi:lipocalin family protein [Chitinilyticum piscinae]|uniref:Outer membrane lipoprotein Blc n=1 Tax=Chitinilyticum piscinae TaxID=2866724 RepID=A0A8J7FLH4_9NEIS|nr:lipocalin family protein [Chitinilyticum piscinae]MBE9610262.1 lipocalin family protein [Chitinilyticum piscinae]
MPTRFLAALLFTVCSTMALAAEVQTVPAVDLGRYLGKWYEIAAFPMRFQAQCTADTTAEYSMREDGLVRVINRCRTASGDIDSAEGRAKVVAGSNNSKLRVTFFWPFYGDYWVIGLDPEYRWAVVGHPSRDYLWLLSRTPQLEQPLLDAALTSAIGQGYSLERLRYTAHGQQQ